MTRPTSRSNASPSVRTQHEEFGHIPSLRALLYQNQPRQLVIHADKKGMPVRFAPIQWELRVAESPVVSQLDFVELAEIVSVQLEKVREDRFLAGTSGNYRDTGLRQEFHRAIKRRQCPWRQGREFPEGSRPGWDRGAGRPRPLPRLWLH